MRAEAESSKLALLTSKRDSLVDEIEKSAIAEAGGKIPTGEVPKPTKEQGERLDKIMKELAIIEGTEVPSATETKEENNENNENVPSPSSSPSSPYSKSELGSRVRAVYDSSPFFLKPLFVASLDGLNPSTFKKENGEDDDVMLAEAFEKLDSASKLMFITQMEAFEEDNPGSSSEATRMNLTAAILSQVQAESPDTNTTVFSEFARDGDVDPAEMGVEIAKSMMASLDAESNSTVLDLDDFNLTSIFEPGPRLEGTSMMIEGLIPDSITNSDFSPELWSRVETSISKYWTTTDSEKVPGGYVLKGRPTLQPLTNTSYLTIASGFKSVQSEYSEKIILSIIEEPFIKEDSTDEREPAVYVALIDSKNKENGYVKALVNGFSLLTLAGFTLGVLAGNEEIVNSLDMASKISPNDPEAVRAFGRITGLAEQTFAGVGGILVGKELVKGLIAKEYGVELGGPVVLPSLNFGALGTVRRMKGQVDGRGEMFDLGFGSAAVGFGLSLGFLVLGLSLGGGDAVLPAGFLRSSALAGGIIDLFNPGSLTGPDPMAGIHLHPLAVAGFTGIITTALNCLPIGQTDGGRVTTALFGRQAASVITAFTLLVCFIIGLFGNDIILFYAAIAAITQREMEVPARNEIDEVDDARGILGILGVFVVMLSVLPLPIQTPY
ncbi:hypothetical protein TrST_g11896 [Triparma strigata]|uniref:Uncharacterized protein n=1 Tax=Triparma strigata TaxID=1606541 RepID=A0A9W6ZGH3_9STRA|nr:hypothetical protein TrST_g11896 [Triparma strigata]